MNKYTHFIFKTNHNYYLNSNSMTSSKAYIFEQKTKSLIVEKQKEFYSLSNFYYIINI